VAGGRKVGSRKVVPRFAAEAGWHQAYTHDGEVQHGPYQGVTSHGLVRINGGWRPRWKLPPVTFHDFGQKLKKFLGPDGYLFTLPIAR